MATNYVSQSSNQRVKDALRLLSRYQFKNKRLLGPHNVYMHDLVNKTRNSSFSPGAINVNHISQYIASSILVHCFDGWNFISRSLDSLLAGDNATSIHMAYYSELRCAMSILASEGIGVFNLKHLFFDSTNSERVFSRNTSNRNLTTHLAAKELMDEWASLPNKKKLIFDSIQVNSRTLEAWITASGHTTSGGYASSLLGDWLKLWSVDLKLDIDQNLRNETSYRPHFVIPQVNINARLDEIIEIWKGLEPSESNSFPSLDMHILRLTLEQLFKMSTGRTYRHSSYIPFINRIFDDLGETRDQELYEFIFRRREPLDHFLLREAKRDSSNAAINFLNPMPMICRAILLQRFSTGIAKAIFKDSSVNFQNLRFWWQDAALKYGLIDELPTELNPIELYADVADSIQSIRNYDKTIGSIKQANVDVISDCCNLRQFQRICFWGMGL